MRELRPKYGHWVIFDHCMPFDVSRAYDEAKGIDNPRIWTAERDIEMWQALESGAGACQPGLSKIRELAPWQTKKDSRGPTGGRPIRTRPGRCGIRSSSSAAGRSGLALAADLGVRGVPCVVVDGKAEFGEGSRGLCYAKRTLEILDRLGVGERAVAKGVTWQLGKVFHRDELLYEFNLLPESGHKMPAFINLQQYYLEQFLYERCHELPGVDLRFQNKCVGVETFPDHARIRPRDARRPLRARGRLPDRLRRLALDRARSSWACRSRAGCSRTGS